MISNVDEKAPLMDLLRQARSISTSEVQGDDWRGMMSRWTDLMNRMQNEGERLKQK
jgi:hypothetical protein